MIKPEFSIFLINLIIYSYFSFFNSIKINLNSSILILLYDLFSRKSRLLISLNLFSLIFYYFFGFLCSNFLFIILLYYINYDNTYTFLNLIKFLFLKPFVEYFSNKNSSYKIIKKNYDIKKKSIIYFSGLFQKSSKQFNYLEKNLPNYNHIYINLNLKKNDKIQNILHLIYYELNGIDIECLIGYSFGGSLILQLKNKFIKKNINTILISPGGFYGNSLIEFFLIYISKIFYFIFKNDKWYLLSLYPLYENKFNLSNNDFLITSRTDVIHRVEYNFYINKSIIVDNIKHFRMIEYVKNKYLIPNLIKNKYKIIDS